MCKSHDIWKSHVLRTLQGSRVVANGSLPLQGVVDLAFIIQRVVDLDAYPLPCSGDDM